MALVLANTPRLKPEIALTQALDEYKAILTDAEKAVLKSHHGHPDASAVITLTVDIDRENHNRRSRCVGARLITFLESVQQFTTIVDTFVSSNPNIAALVWGGVKVALLAANNLTSFFDKLSTLFMSIGAICPRFTDFGLLYPSSVGLQGALCNYYAVVIQLCTKTTEFSRKPGLSQFGMTLLRPFEAQFGKFAEDLKRLGQVIRDETSLASKQVQKQEARLQDIERREASTFRSLEAKFRDKASQEQKEAREWRLQAELRNRRHKKLQILNALSTYNHSTAWKQARKKCLMGTATWISARSEFQAWISSQDSSSLWCTGTLGAGKTVLSAGVVAHLMKTVSPVDSVSFFFCRYDETDSMRARTIMGSIAKQLLDGLPLESFSKVDQVMEALCVDIDQIVELLQKVLPGIQRYFVIIDGLDECGEEEVKELILGIQTLLTSQTITVKLFCSSRPDVFRWIPTILKPEWHVSMAPVDVNPDIERYIDAALEQRIECGDLQLIDPTLILLIRDTLLSGAEGMFLWVAFQIETLCGQRSDQGIIDTLHALPKDLPETFDRILGRLAKMEDVDRDNCLTIFKWVAVAKRPLTSAELREVIGIKPCQKSFIMKRLINDMSRAMACCGSLIEIDEEESTIRFAHHSVKQYLLSAAKDPILVRYHFDLEEADTDSGEICVTYLSFEELTMHVTRGPISQQYASAYPHAVLKESIPEAGLASRIALKLLKTKRTPNYSFHRRVEESIGITEVQRLQQAQHQFAFLDYARTNWLSHTKTFTEHSKTWQLWSDLVRKDLSTLYVSWKKFEPGDYDKYDIREIIRENHYALLLLKIYLVGLVEITVENERNFRRWIHQIILEGNNGLLRVVLFSPLVRICSMICSSMHDDINTVLAGLGNLKLLEEQAKEEGIGLNTVELDGLLQYKIVPLLKSSIIPGLNLDSPLQALVCNPETFEWNGLTVAAALGQVPVVEYLIALNRKNDGLRFLIPSFNEIFIQAAIRKQIRVLHVLLDQGAEYLRLDVRDLAGFTPLMYVTVLGYMDLVEKLIGMGARLTTKDLEKLEPLIKATDTIMVKEMLTLCGVMIIDPNDED